MNPFPGPRSVLVLDNVNSHLSEDLATMCEEAGVHLEYLPLYLPDYNPIEEGFSTMKKWMQRHRAEAANFENFGEFIGYTLEAFEDRHLDHFRSCNIIFEEDELIYNN